jgi:hypothetical protein
MRWKDEDGERPKRGGCYEGEKQRGKGRQEGAAEKPQREEIDMRIAEFGLRNVELTEERMNKLLGY